LDTRLLLRPRLSRFLDTSLRLSFIDFLPRHLLRSFTKQTVTIPRTLIRQIRVVWQSPAAIVGKNAKGAEEVDSQRRKAIGNDESLLGSLLRLLEGDLQLV
jgi:hypothetical protein